MTSEAYLRRTSLHPALCSARNSLRKPSLHVRSPTTQKPPQGATRKDTRKGNKGPGNNPRLVPRWQSTQVASQPLATGSSSPSCLLKPKTNGIKTDSSIAPNQGAKSMTAVVLHQCIFGWSITQQWTTRKLTSCVGSLRSGIMAMGYCSIVSAIHGTGLQWEFPEYLSDDRVHWKYQSTKKLR